jgi:isochorismate synthase
MLNNFEKYLNNIEQSYQSNLPFVVFKKPNELKLSSYIATSNELIEINNFEEEGFVFAPFNSDKKIIFHLSKCTVNTINYTIEDVMANTNIVSLAINVMDEKKLKEAHINIVQKAIDYINKGKVGKIVISREELLKIKNFDLFNSFKKMLLKYPKAFVYIWFHPKIGLWMGATPEQFISVENNEIQTMALAGTQKFNNVIDVYWDQKEIKEQQFVSDYIVNNLKPIVKRLNVSDAFTIKAGNLLHICTKITAKLHPNKTIKSIITKLHPTPAVCGFPKKEATTFILNNENYNRGYYTGFLGELNVNGKSNLFVNLRCMKFRNGIIHIYVGGGITKESIAEKEWEETKNKATTIKSIL